jgi:hypothetical protein
MRSIWRRLAVAALVGGVLLTWAIETDVDVEAQAPKTITATRLYTGTDGQSHAEDIQFPLASATATEVMKATGVQFSRTSPGRFSDWHVGPRRQFVITLQGRGEIELAGGRKITMEPGHIELIEDLTGKGHTTRVIGTEDRITVSIPLADQTVATGSRGSR